nr:GNAT family N-acetyltransferase [Kineosporia rhizophila]
MLLRASRPSDRERFQKLFGSAEVGAYVGGPQPADELERLPEVPGQRPGVFVVDLDGVMIGLVMLERRNLGPADRVRPENGEVDLGYLFLPEFWGMGFAAEACTAALTWFDEVFPGEPVVLCTQTANQRSLSLATRLGFVEVQRYQKFGSEQWFGVRAAASAPPGR